jgi:HEAT repeat protein
MKIRKLRLLAPAILVILGGAWFANWLAREPHHRGKSLREWIVIADDNPNDIAAHEGLRRTADLAVPYYVSILEGRESRLGRFYRDLWPKLPAVMQSLLTEPLAVESARVDAALVLKYTGPLARRALPSLLGCLKDPSEAIRQTALEALGEIESDGGALLPVLIGASRDPFYGVRRVAIEAIDRLGPAAQTAEPALFERLQDDSPMVRACAAGALWDVARRTNEVLLVLARSLHDDNSTTRALSAMYLGHLGPAALPAAPELIKALKDNKQVSEQASEALKRIDPMAAARAGLK